MTEEKIRRIPVVNTYGFDTPPKGPISTPQATEGENWEGPRGVIKLFSWSKAFMGYLKSTRTRYNGVLGILDPSRTWNARDMARVSWDMAGLATHLEMMADRTRKMALELGEYHGYLPPDLPEELGPFQTLEEASECLAQIHNDILRDPEGMDWKAITDLEVERGEERGESRNG